MRLRPPVTRDAAEVCAYYTRNEARFAKWDPRRSYDVADHERWIDEIARAALADGHVSHFVGFDRDAATSNAQAPIVVVGFDSFDRNGRTASISYTIDAAYEGRGYASEAIEAAIGYAFESIDLRSLSAYVDIENLRSRRLLERLGFAFIAQMPPLPGPTGALRSRLVAQRLATPAS